MLMKSKSLLLISWVCLIVLLSPACESTNKLSTTRIADILERPRNYENKEVTIYGTVTGTVSLFLVKYFEIQDETGSIKVVTDRVLPTQGERTRVTGHMEVIEVGADRWIVLREKSAKGS